MSVHHETSIHLADINKVNIPSEKVTIKVLLNLQFIV